MIGLSKRPVLTALFGVVVAAAVVSGCSSTSSVPTPGTVASSGGATSAPTAAPTSSSNPAAAFPCGTVSGSGTGTASSFTVGTALNFPNLGSCSSTITFQNGTTFAAGTSINLTTSLTAPAGAPSPLPTNPAGAGAPTTIEFVTLAVTAGSITVPAGGTAPLQTMTVANTGSCKAYYQTFGTSAAWQGYGSAGTLSGATISFAPGTSSGTTALTAGNSYYIAYVCF